ncbi:MAG: helix-turn-helix transcriptional regulator [Spirochaetales bacterium]
MTKSIADGSKRGSVGILILKALSSGDKYGWEIIKEIEEKSNKEFMLKQPSLYSSLKRMEVSELVTSYWEDSDIGGRRHYYKISEKGLKKLRSSKFEWSDNKSFVDNLFEDEENAENEEQVAVAQIKTVKTPEITETKAPLNNGKELTETPVKTAGGIVLPTINPMQQDLFSFAMKKEEPSEEPDEEETQNEVVEAETEESAEEIEKNKEVFKAMQKIIEIDEDEDEDEEENEPIPVVEKVKEPKQKYTSTPPAYMQMPLFEESSVNELRGMKDSSSESKKAKEAVQYVRSVSSENDFFDIKNRIKNKNTENFLNKEVNYKPSYNYKKDNSIENSNSLYGSFDLKEQLSAFNLNEPSATKKPFNNLGIDKEDEQLKDKKIEIVEEKPISQHSTTFLTPKKEESPAPIKEHKPEDDIDFKAIMGDLYTESENGEQEDGEHHSLKPLPRIDMSDNINISLKPKNKNYNAAATKVEEEKYSSKPVYSYVSPDAKAEPLYDKNEIATEALERAEKMPQKPIKRHIDSSSNINDEYSNELLEETYLDGIKMRVHKKEMRAPLLTTNYVSINKVNSATSIVIFLLMFVELVATFVALTNSGLVNTADDLMFIGAGVFALLPLIIYNAIYFLNPLKKQAINYSLMGKLLDHFIVFIILLVFIYAVNLFLGIQPLTTIDYVTTWLIPAILSVNLLFVPIIKYILFKQKKYYI